MRLRRTQAVGSTKDISTTQKITNDLAQAKINQPIKPEPKTEINTLFAESTDNIIQFYSDAYNDETKSSGAFNDIFNSMSEAKESILLTGWTLSPTEKFKYTSKNGEQLETTLPQLFAQKAFEGTDIVAFPWKNIAPTPFKDDTVNFIPTVEAEIKLLANKKSKETGEAADDIERRMLDKIHIKFSDTRLGYSDHAKMVITDSQKLYMGGLDLTLNRSDINKWHDCHCKIEGPIVQDAIKLLKHRFTAQITPESVNPLLNKERQRDLTTVNKLDFFQNRAKINAKKNKLLRVRKGKSEKRTMQLLTSIRKENYDPEGTEKNINWKKGKNEKEYTQELVETQVGAIRQANNYIYMENQFFTGPYKDKNGQLKESPNLVILELINKIKEKINAGEPFHFYCQLPFRPEGEENDPAVHLILRKQWKTMEWFLTTIQNEIDAKYGKENEKRPSVADYVTFYNIGSHDPKKQNENGYEMKYTHSKLMIIDDDKAFIGSNNCNERSMKGSRDHEVCMYINGYKEEIQEYRKKLMRQHFGEGLNYDLASNNPKFVTDVKNVLNSNLYKFYKTDSTIMSTPWGNQYTHQLDKTIKPPHVLDKTPIALTAAQQLGSRAKKFVL